MFDAEAEIKKLQEEIKGLLADIHILQRNQSSRRGTEGPRGIQGMPGHDGRDTQLIVKTDTNKNVIQIFNDEKPVAEIVPVEGPKWSRADVIKLVSNAFWAVCAGDKAIAAFKAGEKEFGALYEAEKAKYEAERSKS